MLKSAQEWAGTIVTKKADGSLSAATVGPAGTLYVNGVSNGASVTVTGANPYKWSVTLPALTAGDLVSMYITATIDSVATAEVVAEEVVDTVRLSDISTVAIADAVWDELTAGHTAAGSFGGKVSLITSTSITVASPVASGGDVTTYMGDSYKVADGRQIEWGVSSSATLTGGTVKVLLDGVETFTGSVQSEILVRCSDITGTQSQSITEGAHGLQVRVIQPDGDRITVVRANWTSLDPYNL
jgi:hypothetical protein